MRPNAALGMTEKLGLMNIMINDIPDGRTKGRRGASTDRLGSTSEIGRKLKEYYDGLVSSDVPDRFEDLLAQLEKAEKAKTPTPDKKG